MTSPDLHRSTPRGLHPRQLAWVVFGVAGAGAVMAVGPRPGPAPGLDLAVALGFAIGFAGSLIRWRRHRRRADGLVAWALGLPVLGLIGYALIPIPAGAAYTALDIFFLAAYPLMGAALVSMPKPPATRRTSALMVFNGLIVSTFLVGAFALTIGLEVWQGIGALSNAEQVIARVYLFSDVILAAGAAGVLIRRSMIRIDARSAGLILTMTLLGANDVLFLRNVLEGRSVPSYPLMLLAAGSMIFVSLYPDPVGADQEMIRLRVPTWLIVLPYVLITVASTFVIALHHNQVHDRTELATVFLIAMGGLVIGQQGYLLISERQQVTEMRQDLISAVAHEVRTPLTAILASLELLSWRSMTAEETAELVDIGRTQAEHMRGVVEDLVDLTRGSQVGGGLRETIGPLTELVAEAAVEAGVDTVDLAIPDDIWVTADRTRLRRAIGQFLENAIRFGNERVMVVASEKSGTVRIEVHDDGEGVPPRYEQVIWEPFERGAYRLNSAVQGGGLGLSIARQVAIRHGGSAGYRRSMLLGGAVFWIELPGRGSRPVED